MLILPYPIPQSASLAWVAITRNLSNDERLAMRGDGTWCTTAFGRTGGDIDAPQPGDEIGWREEYDDNAYECVVDRCDGSNAIRPRATVKRVVKACRAKDVPHDECMLMGFLEEWSDSPTPREQFEDAIENIETWGFLVEVEVKHG